MLLCSSKLPVAETLVPSQLVSLAIEWVCSSPHYHFAPFSWTGEPEFQRFGETGESFQVGLFENGQICAIHFHSIDSNAIEWTTDFILNVDEHILAFQLYRDAPSETELGQPIFSLPYLIRAIITAGYSEIDNDLKISSSPILLNESNIDLAKAIILREQKYNLPVVYISCDVYGDFVVNPWIVAEKLNGVAHVVFESSRRVSYRLKDLTDSKNPYAGAVEIFYPLGSRRFLPSQIVGNNSYRVHIITNAVFNHLVQLRIEDRFSWSQLQSKKLKELLFSTTFEKKQESQEYAELQSTYEEILSEKDAQIKKLNDQVVALNNNIDQLEAQMTAIENIPILIRGVEEDLYPFEQKVFLLESLQKELRNTLRESRKAHVLTSIIEANQCTNVIDEKRKSLKKCLRGYVRMTSSIKSKLELLGFSITDEGKHIKLVFGGDNRYSGTLSKTSSDFRAGDNTAHDLVREIF